MVVQVRVQVRVLRNDGPWLLQDYSATVWEYDAEIRDTKIIPLVIPSTHVQGLFYTCNKDGQMVSLPFFERLLKELGTTRQQLQSTFKITREGV